jgi:hypothetical protein
VELSLIEITRQKALLDDARLNLDPLPVAWRILRHAEYHLRWHVEGKTAAEIEAMLLLERLQYDDEVRK